jgi:uncharacterized protein YjbI with pentapeptide repeats
VVDLSFFHSESDLSLQATVSKSGFDLTRAVIAGSVNLGNSTCGDLNADSMQVGGDLIMWSLNNSKARFKNVTMLGTKIRGNIDMDGATLDGDLIADGVQIGGSLYMRSNDNKATFKNAALREAKVSGSVSMDGASFNGDLIADMIVSSNLFMRSSAKFKSTFKNISLSGASIKGGIGLIGSSVNGDLIADHLYSESLIMRSDQWNKASFRNVNLNNATFTVQLDMSGAHFDGDLTATSLQVGALLLMGSQDTNNSTFKNVTLRGAKVTSAISFIGANVAGVLDADALEVGHLFMRSDGPIKSNFNTVNLSFATIKGNFDITGTKFSNLTMPSASIVGEMKLGDKDRSAEIGSLDLRNAHVGSLSDNKSSWPKQGQLHLDGLYVRSTRRIPGGFWRGNGWARGRLVGQPLGSVR